MSTTEYAVEGLTCAHCVGAVIEEVGALPGVAAVRVDLVAGGTSTLHVDAERELGRDELAGALDEAGDYRLASAG